MFPKFPKTDFAELTMLATALGISAGCAGLAYLGKTRADDLRHAKENHMPLKHHLVHRDAPTHDTYRAVTGILACDDPQSFDDHGIKYKVCGICSSTAEILTEKIDVIDAQTGRVKHSAKQRKDDVIDRSRRRMFGDLELHGDAVHARCEIDTSYIKSIPFEELGSTYRPGFSAPDVKHSRSEDRKTITRKSTSVSGAKTTFSGVREGTKLTIVGRVVQNHPGSGVGKPTYTISPAPGRYNIVSTKDVDGMISDCETLTNASLAVGVGAVVAGLWFGVYAPTGS